MPLVTTVTSDPSSRALIQDCFFGTYVGVGDLSDRDTMQHIRAIAWKRVQERVSTRAGSGDFRG